MIIIKSKKFAFLKKVGVNLDVIEALSKKDIVLSLGKSHFAFNTADGKVLCNGGLTCTVAELSDGTCLASTLLTNRAILTKYAEYALEEVVKKQPPENTLSTLLNLAGQPKDTKGMAPVALVDATYMHQPVRGSSKNAVYVVVAMGSGVKVAAKSVNPSSLSLRVEGDLTPKIREAFAKHQFNMGASGTYMSAHFNCSPNVPSSRVVGSVLIGSGLKFDTPLPDMGIVQELSHE